MCFRRRVLPTASPDDDAWVIPERPKPMGIEDCSEVTVPNDDKYLAAELVSLWGAHVHIYICIYVPISDLYHS